MNLNDLINDPNIDGLDPQDAAVSALLENAQGNILNHHGRGYALHILLRFKTEPKHLKAAVDWIAGKFTPTSALDQLKSDDEADFLFRMISLSRSGFAALGIPEECQPADPVFQSGARYGQDDPLTGWGYTASPPGLDDHLAPGADALIILAHNEEAKLNAAWQDLCAEIEGFADVAYDADLEGGRPEPGHLLWMGAETGEEMHRGVKPCGDASWYIEYFGYADGISQPRFLKADVDGERRLGGPKPGESGPWGRGTPLSSVFTADGGGGYGSYLAFQKYEQDVEGFHRAVASLRDRMATDVLTEKLVADPEGFLGDEGIAAPLEDETGKQILSYCFDTLKCGEARRKACTDARCNDRRICMDHLNLLKARPDVIKAMHESRQFEECRSGIDLDRVYAMVVGRYRDGRPLVDPDAGQTANGFDFADDPDGTVCPFHAHVRRMNTRGQQFARSSDQDETQACTSEHGDWGHRIARRGMPYQHSYGDKSERSGLYFLSFQSALDNFEELLGYADDDCFAQTGYDEQKWPGAPVGIDPVLGQHPAPANQTWPRLVESAPGVSADGAGTATIPVTRFRLTHYATMRGGGFFYAPSVQYIEKIQELSTLK